MATVTKRKWTHKGVEKEAWIVRYWDRTGSYRSKTFARKKEAEAWRRQTETDIENGTHIPRAESRTVEAATGLFLEDIDAKVAIGALRPTTAQNYHCAFRQAILPAIGKLLVSEITPERLEHWYHDVVRSKRMEGATAYRRLWFIKAMFAFAIRRKWAKENPAIDAMAAIGRPKDNKIEVFNLDEVRAVIAEANVRRFRGRQRAHDMTQLAVNLAAFCGLRWGEIFGLTLDHVDLKHREIRIAHSLDGLGNLQDPKTKAGNRTVPLPEHIAKMLAEFIAHYPVTNKRRIIFHSHNGKPMVASNFRKNAWLPLQRRAGIATDDRAPLHFHALRHFAVSWMIENGWPITDVSQIVGHANVAITLQVYAHVVKGKKQSAEAMQNLASRLLSAPSTPKTLAIEYATDTQQPINA